MKQIKIHREFDHPLQTLLLAREERYKHLDKFPELKNVKTVSEKKEGNILFQERHISIGEALPQVILTLIPSGNLVLIEKSEFHEDTNTHIFHVIPQGMENIFEIKGVSRYSSISESRSQRDYGVDITSQAFLVGAFVEGAIAEVYHSNLEKDKHSIINFLKEMNHG